MRLFVTPAQLAAGVVEIAGDEHHYLARVRRATIGDEVELVDGEGRRARARIAAMSETATTLHVDAPEIAPAQPPHVRAMIPLIKGDRMDACLEKLVEVGADEIVVWPADRAVVRLAPDRLASRIEKFEAIVRAASRQTGRSRLPVIACRDSLAAAIAAVPAPSPARLRLVLDPGSDTALVPLVASMQGLDDVTLLSGPEGGLTPSELHASIETGRFVPVGLGPRVLRAETAPVVATAILRACTET